LKRKKKTKKKGELNTAAGSARRIILREKGCSGKFQIRVVRHGTANVRTKKRANQ